MNDASPRTFCANHPDIETSLRCNRCEKPICPKCSILTPTGYRCKECVRGQQRVFETAFWYDYVLAIGISSTLSFVAALLLTRLGWFVFFLAPVAGVIIAEVVRFATQRRRSKRLFQAASGGILLGCVPLALYYLAGPLLAGVGLSGSLFSFLWLGLYGVVATSSAYSRLAGIRL